MNSSIFDLEKKLISLKSSNLIIAIKAEFEAEGTRIDELSIISYLCTKNKIPLTLKIGGPCAKRDIYEAFQLGANNILVPMVESEFALDFCYRSYNSLIPAFTPLNICPSLSINIESKTGIKNFDSIVKKIKELSIPIKEIVIGRSDLARSFNEKDVNSELIHELSDMVIKKCSKSNINVTLGGNLTKESFQFINSFDLKSLTGFESRKCTFKKSKDLNYNDFNSLINNGLEFELFWLNFKKNMYQKRSEEEINRIKDITERIKN